MVGVVAALGILGGCSGAGTPTVAGQGVAGQNVAGPRVSAAQLHARGVLVPPAAFLRAAQSDRRLSWMSPDAAKAASLLYVADEATGDVYVYSYPAGKLVGTLTGFNAPSGMCSNKAGDVFVLNGGGSTIDVYAHGGTKPLRTLNVPGYPELNCSVDPTTGNLALGALAGSCGDCIAVYAKAQGIPTTYEPQGVNEIPGCGYDNKGNLFCAARTGDGDKFELLELPDHSSSLKSISGTYANVSSGPLQWDGKYVAVGSGATGTIYQIKVSGSTGTVEGSTQLAGTGWVWQFWIAGTEGPKQATRIVAPTYAGSSGPETGYWKYPAGGDATKTIPGSAQPDGATLSIKS